MSIQIDAKPATLLPFPVPASFKGSQHFSLSPTHPAGVHPGSGERHTARLDLSGDCRVAGMTDTVSCPCRSGMRRVAFPTLTHREIPTMRRALTLVLILLTLALSGAKFADYGGPFQAPKPDPDSYDVYENQDLGVSLYYPNQWNLTPSSAIDEWLLLVGDEGLTRLTLLIEFEALDASLADRLSNAIERVRPGDTDTTFERERPVTLADGSKAMRADIAYRDNRGDAVRRVQVMNRGGLTFILVLSTPARELTDQWRTFETMLTSFTSFPPAPYGIARDRAFTMPLGEPATLDPAIVRDTTTHLYVSSLFSGLVRFAPDLSVGPDLAERWEVDAAGVVYTFTLRDGITFHDGQPITADDFKYSIERTTDPELDSGTAPLYLGDIVGVRDKLNGEATEVSGFEVLDERTIRITIDSPKEYFLSKLTYPTGAVVDRRQVEDLGEEWWKSEEINGSGPYKLLRWDPDSVIILQRFDDYHTPVKLEYLISPRAVLPGAGGLDMYLTNAWDGLFVSLRSLDVVRADPVLSEELREFNQLTSHFVVLDGTQPPFDDPKVRRAFAMALDREKLIEEVYEGTVQLANGLLPPGIPGYSESLLGIPFDPDMARQLLAESRYADDFPEVFYTAVDLDGAPPASVRFMLDAWKEELGIEVQAALHEGDEYYYQLEEIAQHLYTYGWVADYPDPENFLDLLLHSEAHDSRYVNPKFDSLVEAARAELDREARLDLFREAEQLLMDDAGIIPIFHVKDFVLVRPHVNDFSISPVGQPSISGITLDAIEPILPVPASRRGQPT